MKKVLMISILCLMFISCRSMMSYDIDQKLYAPVTQSSSKILVLPFDAPSGGVYGLTKDGRIEEGAPEKLGSFTEEKVMKFKNYQVVTWEEFLNIVQEQDNGSVIQELKKGSKDAIIAVAKQFKADFVMAGYVTRYADKMTDRHADLKPASVAFTLFLFNGKDGAMIWKSSYRETQVPLTENLLNFFRYGFKWHTADDLARWGLNEIMKNFPGGRI